MVEIISAIVILGIVFAVLYVFVFRGIFRVGPNQLGIVTKKMLGKKMPQGQIIARENEIGIRANTLQPGLYYRLPEVWQIARAAVTVIEEGTVGLIESVDGKPLPAGRIFGDAVDCNNFQDAEKFYENGGFKGPQVAILRPGNYRINPFAFKVTAKSFTTVDSESTGLVTATDGLSLPSDLIISPEPLVAPTVDEPNYPKARIDSYFQDGQAFLDSKGYKGPQLPTLQPGDYYLNSSLFDVQVVPKAEVQPGYVAVLRSNVGKELAKSNVRPIVGDDNANLDSNIHSDVESTIVTDKNSRGILAAPLAAGKYNLNTNAYTGYLVSIGAITIDWASSDRPSQPTSVGAGNANKMPMQTDTSVLGSEYFKFNQLNLTSQDGFQIEADVRVVIRILPENAPHVIAHFGTVLNLIQGVIHPLIDASFRNYAGQKSALDFFQDRSTIQKESLEQAKAEFAKYNIECQNLLVSYIDIPKLLLDTQTNKQVAVQQQAQYVQQALAEAQRIDVEAKTAMADKQPEVIQAQLQVQINANNAAALVKESEGKRDAAKIIADGQAAAIRRVGEAQADAYHAQADVIGADKVALLNSLDKIGEGNIVVTPRTLVTGGSDGKDGVSPVLSAVFASLLSEKTTDLNLSKYEHKDDDDYQSGLKVDTTSAVASMPASMQVPPSKKSKTNSGDSDN